MTGRPLAGLLLALLTTAPLSADEPKLPDAAAFDKLVVDTLRDVHNKGADLYNTAKDFAGAYRMYQGALLTVRPLLAHRPAAQKLIDEGVAAAEKETAPAQQAFKLHEAIEAVRAHLKAPAAPVTPTKKPEDPVKKPVDPVKKPDDTTKKPDDTKKPVDPVKKPVDPVKKPADPKPVAPAATGGKVLLKGQPLTAAEVTVVSLDQAKPRVFTAAVKADGSYAFAEPLPPGKYVVVVTAKAVPEKYQTTLTSGITIEVKPGTAAYDIDLK